MKVGVVGAGITGLSLAHYLRGRGVDPVVFERSSEPGGVIRSRRTGDGVLELGPQRLRLTPGLDGLVRELGLRNEVVRSEKQPLYVYSDDALRRVPLSIRSAFTTDLLGWSDKLRVLLEPLTSPPDPEETVESLLTRKLGGAVYTGFLGPLYGGIYASDPGEMPIEHSLLGLLRERGVRRSLLAALAKNAVGNAVGDGGLPPPASFTDGLQALPEALYSQNEDYVHLGSPVEGLEERGSGYALVHGDGEAVVDRVVLTTSAYVTADLLGDVDPGTASALEDLNYNSLAVVHLRGDCGLEGMGYQVGFREDLRTLGVTWNASLFPHVSPDTYTCYFGGMRDPEALELGDDELRATAAREFRDATGCNADVVHVERLRRAIPAYDSSWSALEEVDPPDGLHLCANYAGRLGIPARVREAERLADDLS